MRLHEMGQTKKRPDRQAPMAANRTRHSGVIVTDQTLIAQAAVEEIATTDRDNRSLKSVRGLSLGL